MQKPFLKIAGRPCYLRAPKPRCMPPKILVISNYRNTFSVRPEAETFIALARMGFEIDIMTFPDAAYISRLEEAGIRVIRFHPEKKLDKKEISFIRETLQEGGHDILHLFNGRAMVNGIQAAKNLPVKIALYRGYAGNVHWYDPTAYFKFLHPAVDKIVCNSRAVEESLHSQLFFTKDKTQVIIKGHDIAWYDQVEPVSLQQEFDLPPGAFTVMLVANDRPVKDVPSFLRATALIPTDLLIYYILVGQNMDNKVNLPLIENNPNRAKIKLAGFRRDVPQLVAGTDVFALTSLKEGFPKAVVEAMALKRAVVITDIPGHRELLHDGQQGFKIPVKSPELLAEKIVEYYHNPQLRQQMGEAARNYIRDEISLDNTVKEYAQLYREMTGS